MKNLFFKTQLLLILLLFSVASLKAQSHKGLCKVEVDDVTAPVVFKYLNYSVRFINKSNKTVDGIYWTAYFYDNSDRLIKQETSSFNSTKLIDPIASGFTKTLVRAPNVKNATKVIIKINRVHFFDGSECD